MGKGLGLGPGPQERTRTIRSDHPLWAWYLFSPRTVNLRRFAAMGHAREFGVVAMFGVMLLVALPPSFVKGTAEVCHAVHDTPTGPFSCMDCDSCKNCMEGGSCDVHCSTCGPCYA